MVLNIASFCDLYTPYTYTVLLSVCIRVWWKIYTQHRSFLRLKSSIKQYINVNIDVVMSSKHVLYKLTFVPIMRAVDVFLHRILGLFIADHYNNVPPRAGAPVGIVIAFLRDFQAPPCSSRVLSRVNRQITFELLVSSEQTCAIRRNLLLVLFN